MGDFLFGSDLKSQKQAVEGEGAGAYEEEGEGGAEGDEVKFPAGGHVFVDEGLAPFGDFEKYRAYHDAGKADGCNLCEKSEKGCCGSEGLCYGEESHDGEHSWGHLRGRLHLPHHALPAAVRVENNRKADTEYKQSEVAVGVDRG